MKLVLTAFFAAVFAFTVDTVQAESFPAGTEKQILAPELKAGDYIWQPDVSPAGPVAIIVSLSEQTLYVYRNGVRIGRSTVSTGKPGHRTPTGIFTILEKNVVHHSTKYHSASMPYMERLTWDGVAIHAGGLPGYPESHGCVHVPLDFAKKLYAVTDKGASVLITDGKASPGVTTTQPGLLFSSKESDAGPSSVSTADRFIWKPEVSPTGPISILFSSADQKIYVYRNGVQIGRAAIGGADAGRSYGNHVYAALAETTPEGMHQWNPLGSGDGSPAPDVQELAKRLLIPPPFLAQMRAVINPGATLIITDHPVNLTTRSGRGFNILTSTK